MTLLARLIATQEGFFRPGALPARRNNPGDLRHSPHSSHQGLGPDDIGAIDSAADGWADLERQLALYAGRGLTLGEAIAQFAPPNENDTEGYLRFVLGGLGGQVDRNTPVSQVLRLPAEQGREGIFNA